MRNIFRWILNNQRIVIIIYVIALIACAIAYPMVRVNYTMADFLPPGTDSTVALNVMQQEFTQGIPNCRVMVKDVSIPKALEIKESILSCEHVSDVTWLDDQVDVIQPVGFMDPEILADYYVDDCALFTVTVDKDHSVAALEEMQAVAGEDACFTGDAPTMAIATTSTEREIPIIAAVGIAFAMLVLLFTTDSYIFSPMVIIGLGVAVVLNAGSNIIFGQVSFVTNASGSILQMAVSLDYSVFLIHRYSECRKTINDPKEAMLEAMSTSLSSISASGLTTVIGFLALVFMRYRIGADLGLALSKGILISLIVVFSFMPIFILKMQKLIDATSHKNLLPSFEPFGKIVRKTALPAILIFAIIMVPAFLASRSNDYYFGAAHMFGPETELGKWAAETEDIFGVNNTFVLLVPNDDMSLQNQLSEELHSLDGIKSILSYVDTVGAEVPKRYLDKDTLALLDSEEYTRMVLNVSVPNESEETFALVENIRSVSEKYYPGSYYLAGEAVSTFDLVKVILADNLKVNLIAIGAIFVILLFTFKSITLPVILVLSIETAIWINLGIPYFRSKYVFYVAYLIVSSIQLGATVDYAILFTDRYSSLRQSAWKDRSAIETVSQCSVSIISSGLVLTVMGFLMGIVSSHGIISQMGYFMGIGAMLSLAITIFVLPNVLCLFDRAIQKTTKNTNWLEIGSINSKKEVSGNGSEENL